MRREFSRAIKLEVLKRATRDGIVTCEKCGALAKRFQIDHVRPDGLLGEPTIDNAMLICEPCFIAKNAEDTSRIAKAKRQESVALGIRTRPVAKLRGPKFAKSERTAAREPKVMPPRRALYRNTVPSKEIQ